MEWVILASIWIVAAAAYFAGPAYLREKGKNLATREDIGKITEIVERIRLNTHEELERLRANLSSDAEAMIRRRDVYASLTAGMRIFIQGQFAEDADLASRKQDFLDAYAASWLWATDDVVRALNSFILLNMREPAVVNSRQRELKNSYYEVLIGMRRNAGFPDTTLGIDDMVFVQF